MHVETYKDLPILTIAELGDWLAWLEDNFDKYPKGVWIKLSKKNSAETTISYEQAREGALIYGWIDGLTNRLDNNFYTIRFSPRRPKGTWSKINREIVEELIRAGKMKPSGIREVEAAQKDGRWDAAYAGAATIEMPEDFQKALDKNPRAKEFFAKISKTNRYAFLWRIHTARKAETRAQRIEKFVAMLERGEVFH